MSYTQLTEDDRIEIYAMKKAGVKQCLIARQLDCHPSTISNELSRNTGQRGYRAKQAHRLAIQRRQEKVSTSIPQATWEQVEMLIRQELSPEQICGRLAIENQQVVSHEWIYQYIYVDKNNAGDLHTFLRCQKERKKRYGSNDRRGKIPNRVSIDERPDVVDERSRIGDWEADTIIGKGHSGAIVSLVERHSRYTLLRQLPSKHTEPVCDAIIELLMPFKDRALTITKDNGLEFAKHEKVAKALDADIYFAHPYHSWERGLNENTNGLVRQYAPKKKSFDHVDDELIDMITYKLNHRPRKSLGFKTPHEVFFNVSQRITDIALAS
jgi:IS30 family transposase